MSNIKANILDFVFYKKFKVLLTLDEEEIFFGMDVSHFDSHDSSSGAPSLIKKT